MTILQNETRGEVMGVPGRFHNVVTWPGNGHADAPNEIANQVWTSEARAVSKEEWGGGRVIRAELRFDDNCKNGQKSFGMTATIERPGARDCEAGGCIHGEVVKYFPELAPLVKWHLCDTRGPMHYVANTVYLAGDRDCHGLCKGEERQIVNGRTGKPCWVWQLSDGEAHRPGAVCDAEDVPRGEVAVYGWEPLTRIGEGKERQLDAARKCAVWSEATDAELSVEPDELRAVLEARRPALAAAFGEAMAACGFL